MKNKRIIFAFALIAMLSMAITVSATYIPKLGMSITIPEGYTSFETGLEKGEYAYFISNETNQYISIKATVDDTTKEINSFDDYTDSELVSIASKIAGDTSDAKVSVYKTSKHRFIKVVDSRHIYYTMINGKCISIAAVKTDGTDVENIEETINTIVFDLSVQNSLSIAENYKIPTWIIVLFASLAVGGIVAFNIMCDRKENEYHDDSDERF